MPATAEAFRPAFDLQNTRPFIPREWQKPSPEKMPAKGIIVDLLKKERKNQQEYFFSSKWLEDNVAAERKKPLIPGEIPWYHLAGTGFWVKEQTDQLIRNTKGTMREVAPDVLDLELSKVKQDKLAFVDEYLEQMLNLKFNLGWKEVHGEQRIVCPDYGNVLWESVTDPKEREGAVYEAIAGNPETGEEGLEAKLRKAPNGSMGIAISNEGWSGLHDADGKPITFPETQIYLIKKQLDGTLQAYTLRYKANISQNEALQRSLGQTVSEAPNERERIKQLIKNTAIITPEDAARAESEGRKPVRDFSDVVDLMQEVVGGREIAYEGKTFDEMRYLFKHPEAFIKPHPLVIPLIERFQAYARGEILKDQPLSELTFKLQVAMALTILQMNKLYREEEKQSKGMTLGTTHQRRNYSAKVVDKAIMFLGTMTHHEEVKDLQERPGCAGGGNKNTGESRYSLNTKYVSSMGVPRIGVSNKKSEDDEQEWFSCSECGWKATEAIGDAACGGCGFTKKEYEEKYGVVC